jgi:hypothetical protein
MTLATPEVRTMPSHESSQDAEAAAAAELMAVVERLARQHLDETVEPDDYRAALRALAESGTKPP